MSDVARRGDCQDAAAIRAGHGGHFGRGQGKIKRNGGDVGCGAANVDVAGLSETPFRPRAVYKTIG